MKRIIFTAILILVFCFAAFAQSDENDSEILLVKVVELSDEKFYKLEVKSNGIFLNGIRKNNSSFLHAIFLLETPEYWNYENSGYWFLIGTDTATGLCGIPEYAMIHIDSNGNLRVSKRSPSACIGDFPSSIHFKLNTKVGDSISDVQPVWRISTALEFDGSTFAWKDLQIKSKTKTRRK